MRSVAPAPAITSSAKPEILGPPSLPPDAFDPVANDTDRAKLEELWLPSRPDPELEPELYEHWREMFSGPTRFVQADSQEAPLSASNSFGRITGCFETSRNWSGAYLLPHRANRFTRVVGRWQVPNVRLGSGPNPNSLPFRCSVWVGLDGKNAWAVSMPQVGTLQTIDAQGAPIDPTLWWQWWVKDGQSAPYNITGVPVRSGDVVLCSLTVMSSTFVRFHVKNKHTGYFATVAVSGLAPVYGSSAQWIVERPADEKLSGGLTDPGPLFPLPDYGAITLDRCAARAESAPGSGAQQSTPWHPQLINMVQTLSGPTRSAVISAPARRDQPPNTLLVTYRKA
jgi:hypothetical protein